MKEKKERKKDIRQIFFIQADNTTRENKNSTSSINS